MVASVVSPSERTARWGRPGVGVRVVGVLMALWCVGFATVNAVFEATDWLAGTPYAGYPGISVMNWFVAGLKLVGAAVALLTVAGRPRFVPPAVLGLAAWGAFATLAVYSLGSVAEAVGMLAGLAGGPDQVTGWGIGYVLFFLSAAAGFGVLAVSHSRRYAVPRRVALLGALGAPALLALILLVVPTVLAAFGLLPTA